jgi:hypothetical protein
MASVTLSIPDRQFGKHFTFNTSVGNQTEKSLSAVRFDNFKARCGAMCCDALRSREQEARFGTVRRIKG